VSVFRTTQKTACRRVCVIARRWLMILDEIGEFDPPLLAGAGVPRPGQKWPVRHPKTESRIYFAGFPCRLLRKTSTE